MGEIRPSESTRARSITLELRGAKLSSLPPHLIAFIRPPELPRQENRKGAQKADAYPSRRPDVIRELPGERFTPVVESNGLRDPGAPFYPHSLLK